MWFADNTQVGTRSAMCGMGSICTDKNYEWGEHKKTIKQRLLEIW